MTMALFGSFFLTGCATQEGIIFSDYSGPLTHTPHEISKTAIEAQGSNTTILGLFTFGDASGESIAQKAGFTKIYRLDYRKTSLLGGLIFSKYTVIVTGESSNSWSSVDGTRTVKLVGYSKDAFLYDTSGKNGVKPIFLDTDVRGVAFTGSEKSIRVTVILGNGVSEVFDLNGHAIVNPVNKTEEDPIFK